MKKLIATAGAVSMLAFGGMVSAEEQLSLAAMDDVTAGGAAVVTANAVASGVLAVTEVLTSATTENIGSYPGQLGSVAIVQSIGSGATLAASNSNAIAFGSGAGSTIGTLASDVFVTSTAATTPGMMAASVNNVSSTASTIVIGDVAASVSAASSTSALGTGVSAVSP